MKALESLNGKPAYVEWDPESGHQSPSFGLYLEGGEWLVDDDSPNRLTKEALAAGAKEVSWDGATCLAWDRTGR